MLRLLYRIKLEREIRKRGRFPEHIVVIGSNFGNKFKDFVDWCEKFGIKEITICTKEKFDFDCLKSEKVRINVVNFSGKEEIVEAIRKIAEKVLSGEIKVEEINEELFESLLSLRSQPDLIVKAGKEIPDFLIWQSIYSELLFTDVDWGTIRYIDFLRIIREYQGRERRYGR
ncbi:MAG: undecaprenyl diphosphate synthase family protein [Archaeoglobaceae archaeon]